MRNDRTRSVPRFHGRSWRIHGLSRCVAPRQRSWPGGRRLRYPHARTGHWLNWQSTGLQNRGLQVRVLRAPLPWPRDRTARLPTSHGRSLPDRPRGAVRRSSCLPRARLRSALRSLRPVTGKLRVKIGIADQKAEIFADARLRGLGLRYVRRSVAWDALRSKSQSALIEAWLAGARAMGAEPLITFSRASGVRGRTPPAPFCVPARVPALPQAVSAGQDVLDVERGEPLRRGDVPPAGSRGALLQRDPAQLPRLQGPGCRPAGSPEHGRAGRGRFGARRASSRSTGACTTTSTPTASRRRRRRRCCARSRARSG